MHSEIRLLQLSDPHLFGRADRALRGVVTRSSLQAVLRHARAHHWDAEALLLEANYIKQLKPRYNVLLRDDKSFPYLHFETGHEFPRLSFYRGSRKEPGRFFGPYPSAGAVRETLHQLQKLFRLRNCDDSYFANRSRPCLQYQIKRCPAPCVLPVSREGYGDQVRDVRLFLDGKSEELLDRLRARMTDAAARTAPIVHSAIERSASCRMKPSPTSPASASALGP